jgi:hypothetical protein
MVSEIVFLLHSLLVSDEFITSYSAYPGRSSDWGLDACQKEPNKAMAE